MASPESKLQRSILDYLERVGVLAWKNILGPLMVGGKMSVPNPNAGQPDIFGILPDGKFLMIEVKMPNYEKTHTNKKAKERVATQKEWCRRCNARGAHGFFATSLEDVHNELVNRKYLGASWIDQSVS